MTDELEDLRRRAEQCVTHHPGCDCREYRLAALKAEAELLKRVNAEIDEAFHDLPHPDRGLRNSAMAQLRSHVAALQAENERLKRENAELWEQGRLREIDFALLASDTDAAQTDAKLIADLVGALESAKRLMDSHDYQRYAARFLDAALAAGRERIADEPLRQSGDGTQADALLARLERLMDAMADRALPEDLRPEFNAAFAALRKAIGKEEENDD